MTTAYHACYFAHELTRQRQQIFEIEDQIIEKRDKLIDSLQRRMSRKTSATPLFTIYWRVV